jgi:large repetitive protein
MTICDRRLAVACNKGFLLQQHQGPNNLVSNALRGGRGAAKLLLAVVGLLLSFENAFAVCPAQIDPSITHRVSGSATTSISYCELCGIGSVTIRFSYPGSNNPDLTNLVITENLGSSGLTYVTGTTTFSVNNGAAPASINPTVSGANGSVLTWNLGSYVLPASSSNGAGNAQYLDITFQVRRADSVTQEGLVTANRTVNASISYETTNEPNNFDRCDDVRTSGSQTLPLREPIPVISKGGRNRDAAQTSYSDPVHGHNNDDIIWRIQIQNTGMAGLQDLRFDDLMQGTDNMVVNYACPTEGAALAVADNDGVAPGGSSCVAASNTIDNFIVTSPFGHGATSSFTSPYTGLNGFEVDVTAGGTANIYLVGKLVSNASCVATRTNTVYDVQWGCGIESPAGGITTTSTGSTPTDVATLRTRFGDGPSGTTLTVNRQLTGTVTSQPVGTKGTMTITITNNTGGTVKNITMRDVLPTEYVMDPTFTPTVTMSRPGGFSSTYAGMIDNIVWTNPATGTFPLTTTDPALPLSNTAPEFTLTSTGCSIGPCGAEVHTLYADQRDMLRHGDTLTIVFRVVLIRSPSYDKVANLDVRTEVTGDGTDPTHVTTLSNTLTVNFETFCGSQGAQSRTMTGNGTATNGSAISANPEDIDVDIVGGELVFILTNDPNYPLPLSVQLTNNGGHTATDYRAYVTFGATMEVTSAPAGCSVTSNPPLLPPWRLPAPIPANATVYQCTSTSLGTLTPGQTRTLNFQVIKTSDSARVAADDLTFRADVIGEITLSNGTPLWFPTPTARGDGVTDRANNYTIDGVRARVIGFNLLKSQVGTCTENNPPPSTPDNLVQIGEECTFHIETGGWFGFQTPGFTYIAVQRIQTVDELPDGQGYITSTDPLAESTSAIQGVSLNPSTLAPLDEGFVDWTHNQLVPSQRITERDHWFRVNITTRFLNDPIDASSPPNRHAALSRNVLNSTFQAVFYNDNTNEEDVFNLGQNTVGYPPQAVRRVDMTVTEPRLTVVKEVCNETLYGMGPACSNWTTLANDGDAFNSYIYRLTVTNEASSDGVARAPAYDVIVTDILDASDLAFVRPFTADGLDNDGDAATDEATGGGEGSVTDNVVKNGTPAEITFSYTHSSALQRINAGQSIRLYYRIDYDDDAAPLQTFTNIVGASYDSLEGEFGNQSVPQRPNSDVGGARAYQAAPASAAVRMIPVVTQPKRVTRLSNRTPSGGSPQEVTIGEEVEYELTTSLPVSLLRNFVIRDELPTGIRCVEAPAINLNAPPYDVAGFQPGGIITPTCTDSLVEWNFGNQRVTSGTTNNRYDFSIRFIARVENIAANNGGVQIVNGGAATAVTARYIDEASNTVVLDFGASSIVIREPQIALAQSFAVANADAADIVTVTVTATNTGNATAYDLRVLDDLTSRKLTFLGSLGGSDPPDVVDTATLGANRPIFQWSAANPRFAIAAGSSVSFTFQVRVDGDVQPQEVLDNTIEAMWSSLPSQATALNSTGTLGADGSASGRRIGALPNAGHAVNNYEATANASMAVPAITMAKTDLSTTTVPTIGAHKQFRIEVQLPEGTTNNLSIADNLATSGLSYVLANNTTFDITYTFHGIASINGQPPTEAAFTAFPADNTTGVATWNIGTVVTATENDLASNAITPTIRIEYYARVNNDVDTDVGDTLQNTATTSYTHGETGATTTTTASTAVVTVVEPRLTLSKTVANVSTGKQPTDQPVTGDVLEYRIIAANTGNATAFDSNIVDTLPPGLELYSGFTPTATINLVPVAGFVPTPAGAPAGPLVWGRENNDGSLDVPAGQTLTLTYRSVVRAITDQNGLIQNAVVVDWTSLDDTSMYERTGDGCPTISAPNDYCAGPATASVTGGRPIFVFQKTVINQTTGQNPGSAATPGDTLRYRLTIRNVSGFPLDGFALLDEPDELNNPAVFAADTLSLVSVPIGANTANTNGNGGAKGTGIVDIRNLNIGVAGSPTDTIAVEFDVQLAPVIAGGSAVLNQARLVMADIEIQRSDDPNINGADDPQVNGDEDPTRTLIAAAPSLRVLKTSQDLSGDLNELRAGDSLRYTITVQNVGTENAINVALRDQVPANTTYVPSSTRLNGTLLSDPSPGVSPLENGVLINAANDTTAGRVPADASGGAGNTATITFDVVVSPDVIDGTIISNQGFVTGAGSGSGAFPEVPSDDPATPVMGDPTRNVVGNLPMLYAHKTVQLQIDNGSTGIVDPADVLRYTITITNSAATPATGIVLSDPVPANTTYVPGSAQLNGSPVAGASAPVVQVPIGTLASGASAVVIFDVQVNAGVATGTVISNQGNVTSNELPTQLTDADGVPSNGFQPTLVVVGNAQQLQISKEVAVVGGGTAESGGQLEYIVRVANISAVPATNVVITDDFGPLTGQLTYVASSGSLNGSSAGVSFAGDVLTANYAGVYGDLASGATAVLRFRANIANNLAQGTRITNTAQVAWNSPSQSASASVSIEIGGSAGSAVLNGRAWHDINFNDVLDNDEQILAGWTVTLLRNGQSIATTTTASDGTYRLNGLAPNDSTSDQYELRFTAPGASTATALLGEAHSIFTNGLHRISAIIAGSGSNVQNLNLPIDPNGVVYNAVLRTPIAGARVSMLNAATRTPLPTGCFADPGQQGQLTPSTGHYKFDLIFGDAACPAGAGYLIEVTPPAAGYIAGASRMIPAASNATTAAFSVPNCPATADDAIPTTSYCESQSSALAPASTVPAGSAGTKHYLHLTLSNGAMPQESQIFNNHIPLDPRLDTAVAITKTTPLTNVTRGTLVPYTITFRNTLSVGLTNVAVVDTLPPGFKYVEGSGRLGNAAVEPIVDGRQLRWENIELATHALQTIKLLAVVGAGVTEGDYVNTARVVNGANGEDASGSATATVRVIPDPTFDCTDIIGKVFDDVNLNGYQDDNEKGLANVRIVSARGLLAKTDAHGRYHITCAAIPNEDRGSNFILKVDDRTLPSGYRMTTENPLVLRATRGKTIKFNFGAALHRVVRLDIADGVFEPNTAEVRPQWATRFGLLLKELRKAPSLLRISYLADVEDATLVNLRVEAVKADIYRRWAELNCCYPLAIETETYWRRGAPPDRSAKR